MGGTQSHEQQPARRRNPFRRRRKRHTPAGERAAQSIGSVTGSTTSGSSRELSSFSSSLDSVTRTEMANRFDLSELYGGDTVVEAFRYIEGRKFFNPANIQYMFPSDEMWSDRMMLLQSIYKDAWTTNFSSPVSQMLLDGQAHVLDVGCGPGAWVLDNARMYPHSTFIGLDLAPHFPLERKPPNAGFLQYNILDGLPFPDETFHFTFERIMLTAVADTYWVEHITEMARVTKYGGWVECMEMDTQFENTGPVLNKILVGVKKHLEQFGHVPEMSPHIKKFFQQTGFFEDIKLDFKLIPIGNWGGENGLRTLNMIQSAYVALKPFIKAIIQVDEKEYEGMIAYLPEEVEKYHTKMRTFRCYAKKVNN